MPMARSVTTSFRSSDDTLRMLVTARREEVQRLQKAQADQLNDLETRGHERIASLRRTLPATFVEVLDALDKTHEEASAATKSHVEGVKARQADATVSPENETGAHPGLAGGHLVAPNSLGWFTPYYGVLHASDGTVYWQGYIPPGKIVNLSDFANGAGSGIFGTGAGSFTVYMDWWFIYTPPVNRNYAHTIYVPFHGFYILYADDGFWDSKEAHARIDLSAVGLQYYTGRPLGALTCSTWAAKISM